MEINTASSNLATSPSSRRHDRHGSELSRAEAVPGASYLYGLLPSSDLTGAEPLVIVGFISSFIQIRRQSRTRVRLPISYSRSSSNYFVTGCNVTRITAKSR
jgi:hypothetical protein